MLNTTPLPREGRVGTQNSPGPRPAAAAAAVLGSSDGQRTATADSERAFTSKSGTLCLKANPMELPIEEVVLEGGAKGVQRSLQKGYRRAQAREFGKRIPPAGIPRGG